MDKSANQFESTIGFPSRAAAEVIEQIDSWNEQSWNLKRSDTKRALALAVQARDLADVNSYERGVAYGYRNSGYCHHLMGEYKSGLAAMLEALTLFEGLEDKHAITSTLNCLIVINQHLGEYSQAIELHSRCLGICEEIDDRGEASRSFNLIGGVYFMLGDYAKALNYFQQNLQITGQYNDLDSHAAALSNIGVIYEKLEEYEEAAAYYLKAVKRSRETGDTATESGSLANLGTVHMLMGDHRRALMDLGAALELSQSNGNRRTEGAVFISLGRLFQTIGEYEKALDSYRKALRTVQQIGHKQYESEAFIGLGEVFRVRGDYAQAVDSLSQALSIAEEIGHNENIFKAHHALSQVYEQQADFARALEHHKAFYEYRQKVFGQVADKNLKKVMIQAEVEKAENEAEIFRLRHVELGARVKELEELTLELKFTQQKVLKLEKLAIEEQMAGGFAHEMRNALAGSKLILDQALALDGPEPHISLNLANCRSLKEIYLELKGKLPENNTKVVLGKMQTIFANEERLDEIMQLVRKATSRGLNITQQIMDYSKIGQQQPGHQRVDLQNLIVSIVNEAREEFSSQGIVIEYKSERQLLSLLGDETHFYSIIKNIILNGRDALIDPGLKDRKDQRRIEITTALAGSTCSVVITDNGVGIPRENLQKVFEPFFSTKPATGTGLGLGMVKKLVSLYNGSIDVRSNAGLGTSVAISLPLSQQAETL